MQIYFNWTILLKLKCNYFEIKQINLQGRRGKTSKDHSKLNEILDELNLIFIGGTRPLS